MERYFNTDAALGTGGLLRLRSISLIVVVILLLGSPVSAIIITVDTEIPDFVLEGYLNLTGTTVLPEPIGDFGASDFEQGTLDNLTIEDGALVYRSTLDVEMLNDGAPVLEPGNSTAWDSHIWAGYYVLVVDDLFYMYYTGSRSTSLRDPRHIGLARSGDGINWVKYGFNPILRSREEAYDYTNLMSPVVLHGNDTWHMWYAGNHGNDANNTRQDIDICYATSTDGINWSKHPDNPVIENGGDDWKDLELRPADVYYINGAFLLFINAVGKVDGDRPYLTSAESTDGVDWYNDLELPIEEYQYDWTGGIQHYSTFEFINGSQRIWTFGNKSSWSIGWATAFYLPFFVGSEEPFLVPQAGTIYSKGLMFPRVVRMDGHYLIYAQCHDDAGIATIGLFKATPEPTRGRFVSRVIESEQEVTLVEAVAEGMTHAGVAGEVYLRWGDGPSDMSYWMLIERPDDVKGITGTYFQYRIDLRTDVDWEIILLESFGFSVATVEAIDVQVDDGPWVPVDGTFEEWYLNLTLEVGLNNLSVRLTDTLERETSENLTVKVDLHSPTGSISMPDIIGKMTTNDLEVHLEANDTHQVTSMMLSFDPTFSASSWMSYSERGYIEYTGADGEVTIYARFRDEAGRVSDTVNDTVIVDRTPPVIVITRPTKHKTSDPLTRFEFEVEDNLDDELEFGWHEANEEWRVLGETNFKVRISNGQKLIQIYAQDDAGNVAVESWRLDWEEEDVDIPIEAWLALVVVIGMVVFVAYSFWRDRNILK